MVVFNRFIESYKETDQTFKILAEGFATTMLVIAYLTIVKILEIQI